MLSSVGRAPANHYKKVQNGDRTKSMMRLVVPKGFVREIRLPIVELVDPPVNEQDLAISAATEIQWIMVEDPADTTAVVVKTLSGADISFIDDFVAKFLLSKAETNFEGRRFWELRMTLGGQDYRSEEIGEIDGQPGIAVAYP